ncbi:hypothetical protein AC249_AIPGENE19768 [Exaiptasia diaphana]|nr:hypothetical protein AC249_AIPGENE19768 [Exaiptasia diaphana]
MEWNDRSNCWVEKDLNGTLKRFHKMTKTKTQSSNNNSNNNSNNSSSSSSDSKSNSINMIIALFQPFP